jgi:predicted porin
MKKHILAAAVAAAVAVPAMAQNVTISGVLDLSPHAVQKLTVGTQSLENKGTGNDFATGHSASNRINFAFSEDLGGGLKADGLYRLRYNNGEGGLDTADDLWLRVSGSFGQVKFGRHSGFIGNIEGLSGAFNAVNSAGGIGGGGSNFIGGDMSRNTKAITANTGAFTSTGGNSVGVFDDTQGLIQYVSPSFSGVSVTVDFANRTQDESGTAGQAAYKQKGLGIEYKAGKLQIQAATATKELTGTLGTRQTAGTTGTSEGTAASDGKVNWIAANYDLGVAKVFITSATREDKSTAGAKTDDVKLSTLGIQVPMGAITLFASIYDGDDKNTGVAGAANTEKRDLSGMQLAARYALSKRTAAYVVTGKSEDKGATANTNFKKTQTAIGLVHSF